MQPIERTLACAEGYLQLGLLEDALQELERLSASDRRFPEALHLEVAILVRAQRWEEALACSEELIRTAPQSHHGYLHTSFCLHELGRTLEARDRLLAAPVFVTEQALFYYNLACYEAQLENPDEAASLLRIAFRRDDSLCQVAMTDRDLEPVREMVRTLVQTLETAVTAEDGPGWKPEAPEDSDSSL
jgi:tetratricopeptide (TPR) repeat protein